MDLSPPATRRTLTSDEAARYLGMSPSWLNQQRSRGKGPRCTRMGRTVRYQIEALDEFLAKCTVETADTRQTRH